MPQPLAPLAICTPSPPASAAGATRRLVLQRSLQTAAWVAAPAMVHPVMAQGRRPPTPRQTEGPYYPITLPADSDGDLLRNGNLLYAQGQPLWVQGQVTDTDGVPLAGGVVEIWQCDAAGHYHHPGDGNRAAPGFQGFGRVSLGRDGRYRFRTIRPAPYTGRTPHIHFKVRLPQRELLTTQMYVAGDPGNERDFLWNNLSDAGRAALTVPLTQGSDGATAEFGLVVQA